MVGNPVEWDSIVKELIRESLQQELGRDPVEDEITARMADNKWKNLHSGEIQKRMLQKYWNSTDTV